MTNLAPLGRAVGQILLGFAFLAIPIAVIKFGLLPPLKSALGYGDAPSPFLSSPMMLAAMMLGYWGYVRLVERRPAVELVPRLRITVIGVASGIALIGAPVAALFCLGYYQLVAYQGFAAFWAVVPTILVAAVLEELFFRGIVFTNLERVMGSLAAIFVQSVIFAVPHLFNDHWNGGIDLLAGILIGSMWTCLYILWRNIWAVGFHHAAWNLTILATGLPLSGIGELRTAAPLKSIFTGPVLITGGEGGPEPTIPVLAVVAVATALLMAVAYRRGAMKLRDA